MSDDPASHLLRIRHTTRYRYRVPVRFAPHRLVLRPREGHDLRVEELTLAIDPESTCLWTRDIFGNSVAHAHFPPEKADELVIDSSVLIRRFFHPDNPPPPSHSASPYPLAYDSMEHNIVTGYLAPVYAEESADVRDWISTLPDPGSFDRAEDFAVRLAQVIHESIAYRRREEKGVQSPGTTLSLRSGSCRDLATLMMETLRHLGIASRFASGYLDCPATRAARGSTHAWTEVYFPELGWRGFDPTTGQQCDHRHIVTGTSHHPRGVMPVTGRFIGPSDAFGSLGVTVEFSAPAPLTRPRTSGAR